MLPRPNTRKLHNIQALVPEDEKPLPVSSSTPPEFAPKQVSLFREVLTLLNGRGVPYVVSGAFALQKHTGICRDTKDLDLFLPGEHVDEALRHLREDGFNVEITDPVWLAKACRDDFFVDLITGMSNAVITVDMSWIERGTPTEIVGVPTRVLAAEELLASKLFVDFRERFDGADVVHILYRTEGHLDWERLLHLVGEHWQMLLWALVLYQYVYPHATRQVPTEVWNDLLGRFRAEVDAPNGRQFRGTLLDERMFAIDVNEWGLPDLLRQTRARRHPRIGNPTEEAA